MYVCVCVCVIKKYIQAELVFTLTKKETMLVKFCFFKIVILAFTT